MWTVLLVFCALGGCTLADDFHHWKTKHNKKYHSDKHEAHRKGIFKKNMDWVKRHNANGAHSYKLEINKFADLTSEEFNAIYNGYKEPVSKTGGLKFEDEFKSKASSPLNLDWRDYNVVTPVKNQGLCGSCWAFSATGALEGQMAIKKRIFKVQLSDQNLLDCVNPTSFGCNGGWYGDCFEYAKQNGVDYSSYYPYVFGKGTCRYNPTNATAKVYQYYYLQSGDEVNLMNAVAIIGPISVAVDATNLQFYKSGVFNPKSCGSSTTDLNHAMLVVGYGRDATYGDYWIVKNSWGSSWGNSGYAYMARNQNNKCGIATAAAFPTLV